MSSEMIWLGHTEDNSEERPPCLIRPSWKFISFDLSIDLKDKQLRGDKIYSSHREVRHSNIDGLFALSDWEKIVSTLSVGWVVMLAGLAVINTDDTAHDNDSQHRIMNV